MLTISFKSVPSGLKKRILNSTSSKRTKNFANTSCNTCNKSIIHADVIKSPWNVSTIGRVHFLAWLIIITSVYHHKFSTQVQDLKQKRYFLIWSLLLDNQQGQQCLSMIEILFKRPAIICSFTTAIIIKAQFLLKDFKPLDRLQKYASVSCKHHTVKSI